MFVAIGGLRNPNHEMIEISNNPILIPRMPFGKHKGMIFSEVPADYLIWLLGTEMDENMASTVKTSPKDIATEL